MFRVALTMTREIYFQTRFVQDAQREVLWRTLYNCYFARLIAPTDCVLELGAGYCYFIGAPELEPSPDQTLTILPSVMRIRALTIGGPPVPSIKVPPRISRLAAFACV